MTRLARRLMITAAIGLAAGSAVVLAVATGSLEGVRTRALDLLFVTRQTERMRATVLVGIDARTYREMLPRYGPLSAWPRTPYARVVDHLREAGARVIFLDVFFDHPKPGDEELVAAMRRAGNVITPVEAQGPAARQPAPGVAQAFEAFVRPTSAVREAAAAEGLVNFTRDADGVVRSVPALLRAGAEDVPSAVLVIVARFVRRRTVLDEAPAAGMVYAAGRAIPLFGAGHMRVNFLGPPERGDGRGSTAIIPFVDVVERRFDPALVRDRIVLIGATIAGVDEHATPTSTATPTWGVEVLAHAVETVLGQRFLVPASDATRITLTIAMALAAALAAAAWRPLAAGTITVALVLADVTAAVVLFDRGILLDLVDAPLAAVVGFGLALGYRVIDEQREQRRVRDVIARYLSPSVSQWVLAHPRRLNLGGESREMTILFSDIRGFTTLSHALEPRRLVELLNEYMSAMTQVVFRHDGVLDKFIGDAVMAFWNAPVDQPDHARRACAAALDMLATLEQLRSEWRGRGWPLLELGIGLNTGEVVVGNMGSRDRLAYTVLGDAVNVSSRLEGLSKLYGVRTVVGDRTRAAAGDVFLWRTLDRVAVKGRSEPLTVSELIARAQSASPETRSFVADWEEALDLYRTRQWAEAAVLFEKLAARAPNDGPCRLYRERTVALLGAPPGDDWDGVYVAETK